MDWKRHRIPVFLTVVSLSIFCCAALAQVGPVATAVSSASKPALSFEVATVKPLDPTLPGHHGITIYPGGRVNITASSVRDFLRMAFNLEDWQLYGLDRWMWMEGFDIQAKPTETIPPTTYNLRHTNEHISDERIRQMLQALLIDRFHLKFHTTTGTGPIFLLERSGKPIRLAPVEEPSPKSKRDTSFSWVGLESDHSWYMGNTSMPEFVSFASREYLHCPVIDHTGLEGSFNFPWKIISTTPDEEQGNENDTFPLFVQAMGLKLTKSTGPVETFIIDHVEHPTAN